jgi:hypothetical protein
MSTWTVRVASAVFLGAVSAIAWQTTRGQEIHPPAVGGSKNASEATVRVAHDPAKMAPFQRQAYFSLCRGADWLCRANRLDGHFDYGLVPELRVRLEGDHYLRQAGAAFGLARAARYTGNERHIAVARQAILTLLAETTTDAQDGTTFRRTALPSPVVNRLASAGLLVLAINELPAPGNDLLEQSEQLCEYIRRQQRPDGSLAYEEDGTAASDPDGVNYYPGEALDGLMRSQQHRPAPWKTDLARKALAYYRPWWQKNKNMAFVPWQTAACAEAFFITKEPAFAEFVVEMTDWLCGLQYATFDPQRPLWFGGFMSFAEGRPVTAPPQVGSAAYAEGLAEAYRVMRQTGDVARSQRYRDALERSLQFTTSLQYTDAKVEHYAENYRPLLVGGFHASHQDGHLRIDYAQHALSALTQYLAFVAE